MPLGLFLYYHRKHVKDTINHQLLPGRNIFWTPRAERITAGLMPPGAFLVLSALGVQNLLRPRKIQAEMV